MSKEMLGNVSINAIYRDGKTKQNTTRLLSVNWIVFFTFFLFFSFNLHLMLSPFVAAAAAVVACFVETLMARPFPWLYI